MIDGSLALRHLLPAQPIGIQDVQHRWQFRPVLPRYFLLFLLCLPAPVIAQSSWDEVREIAGSQHEIVMLLIEKRDFEQVPAAAQKIFDMPFPDDQQHLLVKEAEILTDALLQHNQTQLAHQVIEMARSSVKANKHKAALYREQAYVYKKEGNADAAMECFQRSIELEESGS